MVFCTGSELYFYDADSQKIIKRICVSGGHVYDMKICCTTDEIYLLRKAHISILSSSDGTWLRDICHDLMDPCSIELTGDQHVLICESGAYRVSVWTYQGTLVYQWMTFSDAKPYNIALLPHGKLCCYYAHAQQQQQRNPNI